MGSYFRHEVAKAKFDAADHHAWNRLIRWRARRYAAAVDSRRVPSPVQVIWGA